MIIGIVGEYNDTLENPLIAGCGKTTSMTYFLHEDKYGSEHKTVFSNYYTTFSDEILTTQVMIEAFLQSKLNNTSIGIDEIDKILGSYGARQKDIVYGEKLFSQGRRRNTDIYVTWQRYMDLHIRIRAFLEVILIPVKVHTDYSECHSHRCKKEHLIMVYSSKPFRKNPIKCLIVSEIGKLFDTNQIVNEDVIRCKEDIK